MTVTDVLLENAEQYAAAFRPVVEKHPPFLTWLQNRYLDGLRVTMRRPALVAVVALAVIAGATMLVPRLGSEFLPPMNEGDIHIHHTDCGMLTFEDADFRLHIQEETGIKPSWSAETFSNLEEDVRQSIARIKNGPFIPKKDQVRGFIYDVHTGRLQEVT